MGYAEKRGRGDGAYWRGRYKLPDSTTEKRRYGTVCNPDGTPKRFTRKLDAVRAANTEETEQAAARRRAAEEQAERAAGRVTFAGWAQQWLSGQDLDDDTIGTYRSIIEHHLIGPSGDPPPGRRQFGDLHLDEITRKHISDWEAAQREAGYRPKTILNRRNLLSEILADAADDPTVTLGVNPAQRRRGRGRKAVPVPAPELDEDEDDDDEDDDETGTVITSPLGAVLIAERCSLLSGRDDEFVAVILDFYCGLRWGELTGLEARYAQPGRIRVRWQLRERNGRWYRKLPKFGKRRDVDTPLFLDRLIAGHVARTDPRPCPCHGRTYLFTGLGQARGTRRAVTVADVARDAGVSQGTASTALNHPERVAPATLEKVAAATARTGYTRDVPASQRSPHWYRSGFGQWVWVPAVSGWYPERSPMPRRPVPVGAGPWPGIPLRGRGNSARADACWAPLAEGMTPHGNRHSHKSLMAELRTPEVLSHERFGHKMEGIAGVYSHPTRPMRDELMAALAVCWERSLDARLALCPDSPVPVLDALLKERAAVTRQ
ncbi:MAG TPA: LacI family DNA-binding transcriptional regulator [Streptosporangiaceae bacterium]|nr:LacI family DNA-binding transcriptional regulator [Streptosporangiaceae bacterium]